MHVTMTGCTQQDGPLFFGETRAEVDLDEITRFERVFHRDLITNFLLYVNFNFLQLNLFVLRNCGEGLDSSAS